MKYLCTVYFKMLYLKIIKFFTIPNYVFAIQGNNQNSDIYW